MNGNELTSSGADAEPRVRIEIIPLIDVIFFLLATFVLFTLSLDRTRILPLSLPVVPVIPIDISQAEPVLLQVSGDGHYYWDQEPLSFPEVSTRLAAYAKLSDPKIMLTSDDQANYGDAIRLLDAVRSAGIAQVSIETRYRGTGR